MTDAPDDAGMVVGVFRERMRANAAIDALVRAGFPPEAVGLVEANPADADLLAEVTESDAAEWQQELAHLGGVLVIVSGRRRDDARSILGEHGAEDVAADDDPVSALPTESSPASDQAAARARRIRPGMLVVGSEYAPVGRVKHVEGRELLVDRRPLRRDVRVPLDAVGTQIGDWVILTIPADQIDPMEPFIRPRIGERATNPDRAGDGEQA